MYVYIVYISRDWVGLYQERHGFEFEFREIWKSHFFKYL